MKFKPLVSIYMPTRNRSLLLRRAVDSVLRQTYKNFELIICDDSSDDDTREVVDRYCRLDSRVVFKGNDSNKIGACAARNICIAQANGEYITGIDDDDEFLEDRIELFLRSWRDDYSFLCANFLNVYNYSISIRQYYALKNKFCLNDLLIRNEASNQIFTRTDRIRHIDGFNEKVRRLQDWDTWIRMSAEFGGFYRITRPTYKMHHSHKRNTSSVSDSQSYSEALDELVLRNSRLYSPDKLDQLRRDIRLVNASYDFNDLIDEIKFKKSLFPVVRVVKSKLFNKPDCS